MDAQEVGAVEGGPSLNADKIIEWITNVMAIELTTHQENMIRLHCDGGDMSYRSYARGGYKFAEVMARACREAEERAQQDTVRQMLKGNPVDEAIYDEAALIPDHVLLPGVEEK